MPELIDLGAIPPASTLLWLALGLAVVPALAEEFVFRGLLIRRDASGQLLLWTVPVSLAAYVGWHPIAAIILMPAAWPLFTDVRFLLIVAVLGAACTTLYLRSGSLWPGVAVHWSIVFGWKALGGERFLV